MLINNCTLPTLVFGWRRPKLFYACLSRVFNSCSGPIEIFIDGPADSSQKIQTDEVISIANDFKASYPGTTLVTSHQSNIGLFANVVSSLNSFFDRHDFGIILEDDTIPSPDFFEFIVNMRDMFSSDSRIGHITGTRLMPASHNTLFTASRYMNCWGWATWRSSWRMIDSTLEMLRTRSGVESLNFPIIPKEAEQALKNQLIKSASEPENPHTWDYQFMATLLLNEKICLVPPCNLVQNLGFGVEATHTQSLVDDHRPEILPLSLYSGDFEDWTFEHDVLYAKKYLIPPPLSRRLIRKIKGFIK